MVQTHDSSTK